MRINEVRTVEELADFITVPTEGLVEVAGRLEGDVMVLGGGGKVGPELVETLARADRQAGARRTIHVADLFPDPADPQRARLERLGAVLHAGDFTARSFLDDLPDAPHVIFMAGVKFGSSADWRKAFHLNCIMPYLVGERFSASAVVVYSSGNPYPHTPVEAGGCTEEDDLEPQGVYGWGIVARESAFRTTALQFSGQQSCLFRLMYAQHLGYGVLVDLARMVLDGEPVSLAMPAVNLVSQRDAIDLSLRALGLCNNPPLVLNCAGPVVRVRHVVERLAVHLGVDAKFAGEEPETALLANDDLAVRVFGPYRDGVEEMIEAAAGWVNRGGECWGKPTLFGKVSHRY